MKTPVIALAGGVGGAKLALGLSKVLRPDELTIVVNTGDDEEFYGLRVSPDLDTVMYTLAGLSNEETGWGLAGETFRAVERLKTYGAEAWFSLGDQDLATHMRRTDLLNRGKTLSQVTHSLCGALGVTHPIVPMTDDRVRTVVVTEEGELPFQVYFVKRRSEPAVKSLRFDGAAEAVPSPEFSAALESAGALVICPSNPFLSVAPMLAVGGVRAAVRGFSGLRVAVSPIVGGQSLRGPAAKMMAELGLDATCVGVAREYSGLCDVFVIDRVDAYHREEIEALGMRVEVTDTVMESLPDKVNLARHISGLDQ